MIKNQTFTCIIQCNRNSTTLEDFQKTAVLKNSLKRNLKYKISQPAESFVEQFPETVVEVMLSIEQACLVSQMKECRQPESVVVTYCGPSFN